MVSPSGPLEASHVGFLDDFAGLVWVSSKVWRALSGRYSADEALLFYLFLVGSLLGLCLRLGLCPPLLLLAVMVVGGEDARSLGDIHLSAPRFLGRGVRKNILLAKKTNPRLISGHHLGR